MAKPEESLIGSEHAGGDALIDVLLSHRTHGRQQPSLDAPREDRSRVERLSCAPRQRLRPDQQRVTHRGGTFLAAALLEDYFGQKLFDRPGRRVEPTPAAMALLEDVRAAFDRIALASAQLARRGMRRVLTINAPPSFAMRWLIPRIAAFQRTHPNLELRVATSSAEAAARLDGSDDLIVRPVEMFRAGSVCKLLLKDDSTPLVHPQLRGAERLADPQQLANLVLLHTQCAPDAWRRWFLEHGCTQSDTIDGPLFDDASFALQAALGGVGAALVPLVLAVDELAAGRLVAPFPERTVCGAGYYVLYRDAAPHERGTRELLRWLDAEAVSAPRPPRTQAGQEHALHAP